MFSELVPYLNVSKYKRTKKYVKTKLMIRIFSNKKYFSFFSFLVLKLTLEEEVGVSPKL